MISDRIKVVASPESIQVMPGGRADVLLTVTNMGQVVDRFALSVEGLDPSWYTITMADVSLFPEVDGVLSVAIQPPDNDTATAEPRRVRLIVTSREDPSEKASVDLTLQIQSISAFELELRPQRATTRGGHAAYTVHVTNRGNASQNVSITTADPDDALDVQISRGEVSLPAGGATDVPLRVRPRQRPWTGHPKTMGFRVLATPGGADGMYAAEPLAGAEGTIVYEPPFRWIAAIPLFFRQRFILVPLLLLVGAILVWLLGQPGSPLARPQAAQPKLETAPPTPTPIVFPTPPPPIAVPTVAPAPPDAAAAAAPGAAAGGAAAAGAGGGGGAAAPNPPSIGRFQIISAPGGERGDFAISWEVEGADEVKIGGEPKPNAGTEPLGDLLDSEIELEATNAEGTVRQTLGIIVLRPPQIDELVASSTLVDPGEAVTLSWKSRRGERATLIGQPIEPNEGSIQVQPTSSTLYQLVVENGLGRAERSVIIMVRGDQPEQPATTPGGV